MTVKDRVAFLILGAVIIVAVIFYIVVWIKDPTSAVVLTVILMVWPVFWAILTVSDYYDDKRRGRRRR